MRLVKKLWPGGCGQLRGREEETREIRASEANGAFIQHFSQAKVDLFGFSSVIDTEGEETGYIVYGF